MYVKLVRFNLKLWFKVCGWHHFAIGGVRMNLALVWGLNFAHILNSEKVLLRFYLGFLHAFKHFLGLLEFLEHKLFLAGVADMLHHVVRIMIHLNQGALHHSWLMRATCHWVGDCMLAWLRKVMRSRVEVGRSAIKQGLLLLAQDVHHVIGLCAAFRAWIIFLARPLSSLRNSLTIEWLFVLNELFSHGVLPRSKIWQLCGLFIIRKLKSLFNMEVASKLSPLLASRMHGQIPLDWVHLLLMLAPVIIASYRWLNVSKLLEYFLKKIMLDQT